MHLRARGRLHLLRFWLLVAVGWPAAAYAVAGAEVSYDITLNLDPATGRGHGTVQLRLRNITAAPLQELPVYLYPNLHARKDPDLDDVNFRLRFPGSFSRGGMRLTRARVCKEGSAAALVPAPGSPTPSARVTVRLPEGAATPPGEWLALTLAYEIEVPRRFGLFGRADDVLVMLGGWHPTVPRLTPEGFDLSDLHTSARYTLRVAMARPGLLALGNRLFRVAKDHVLAVETSASGAPLFYFREDFALRASHPPGEVRIRQVTARSAGEHARRARRALAAVRAALPPAHEDSGKEPFVVLEAPLRESLVIPFPGGLLVSDLAFAVTPLGRLEEQHAQTLASAVYAARLLRDTGIDLFDALLTLNLVQFLRWQEGRSDPVFLRRFFRRTELFGAMDTVGTDPQVHFQSSMFFTPQLPAEVARSPALFARDVPSPRTLARMVFHIMGWRQVAAALDTALAEGRSVLSVLRERADSPQRQRLAEAMAAGPMDLVLDDVTRTPDGSWSARVCKKGGTADIPVEVLAVGNGETALEARPCPGHCCRLDLPPGEDTPKVLVDPYGVYDQRSRTPDHPRRNDRNFPDLKWMLNRPYFAVAAGDTFPTASIELRVQPRWDLRHLFFVQPSLTPTRISLLAGWRYGFGRRVRPNFLSQTLSLGLRGTAGIEAGQGSAFGPAVTWTHYTRQSRTNPYGGNWSYLYVYPVLDAELDKFGARFGGMFSQVMGASPAHIFAVRLLADSAAGSLPAWDVPSTGGTDGLRALSTTAVRHPHRLGAGLEYRWMPLRNLHYSVARLAWLTAVQVALFAEAASIAPAVDELVGTDNLYADVGIGLRPHFDVLGVIPGIVSVDVGWLLPVGAGSNGGYNVVLSFYQPF